MTHRAVTRRHRVISHAAAILTLTGFCFVSARAQDSHYWNIAYGTQATLLGGTVIGSANDLSATYYNPGMLAVNREQGLLLGANVYTYQSFKIEGGPSEGTTSSRLAPAPGLIAGRIPVDSTVLGGIAYSILTRQYFNMQIESRFVGQLDLIGDDGMAEQASTELVFNESLSDTWLGATLFRLLQPGVGIGLSNYVAIRNQSLRSTAIGSALMPAGPLSTSSRVANIDYFNVRILWKFGFGLDLGDLTVGMTVTTPSLNLFGSGSNFSSRSFVGVSSPTDTARSEIFAATNEPDLTTHFETAWAIGAGGGYRFGNARVHVSVEWYAPVGVFDVLSTTPYVGQSDGQQFANKITYEMESVFNAGIGLEYHLSESTSLFGSFTTDHTGLSSESKNSLAITAWDLYHFTAGAVLKFTPFDLTVGLSYAGGSEELRNIPWRRLNSSTREFYRLSDDSLISSFTVTGILAFTFRI